MENVCTLSTKHHKFGIVKSRWVFDFEGVTDKQMMDLACKHLVIRMQAKLRAGENIEGWETGTFNVANMLVKREARKPTVETTIKSANLLTDDERRQLIDELNAQLNA